MQDDPEKMTVAEVAAFLDCSEFSVEEAARAGRLPAIKFGRSWVFIRSALIEGLRRRALDNLDREGKPRETATAVKVDAPESRGRGRPRTARPKLPAMPVS